MTVDRSASVEEDRAEVDRIRLLVREASELRLSDDLMVAMAASRVVVIMTDLLSEVAPFEVSGPWHQLTS